ncbi:TRAP transporter large permease [Hippea sp. KM1]|uniref:TRAP transporter large permease n=1 Tax=Hippea sp. KM1 TaxID=944481 RepID=UPI00046D0A20|nr:TRAP transporter large permease [Hippea sp. KM1]
MVWLIVILFILIALSFPISLAIGLSTVIAFISSHLPLYMIAQRMFSGVNSYMLLAVPLFMFAGALMDSGGLSRRIVRLAESMVGHLRGGLAISAILSSMLFAGVSGSAAADTAAIGSILIPSMKRQGYDEDFAASIVASGGSIGVIIPPSIPMIIYGFITSVSIGKLFIAGILPGILIGISLSVLAYIFSKDSYRTRERFDKKEFIEALRGSIWALGTPIIVIGGILGGIFTATESAACAVIYSLIVGFFIYREMNIKKLYKAALNSIITSSVILFIIAVASVFSWYLSMNNVQEALKALLSSFSHDRVVLILVVNLFLLIMGTFVETTASLILFVPVVAPILNQAGLHPITAGVMIVTNLAIGMLTPPLGICLIVSSSIAQSRILSVSKAVLPFLAVMILNLLIIAFFPPLTTLLISF